MPGWMVKKLNEMGLRAIDPFISDASSVLDDDINPLSSVQWVMQILHQVCCLDLLRSHIRNFCKTGGV